ncbi:hypothetical protein ACH4A8_37110 [Streptomyces vietnamensis]|uniref:hypothetical protein n=1 Tax=Streptomyces vietnamensis TaxID=362257 RepID=UPI0037B31E74
MPSLGFILMMEFGYSPIRGGLVAMVPVVVTIAVGATQVSPRLLRRGEAPRVLIVAGLVTTALGAALTVVGIQSGVAYGILLPAMMLAGLGIGLAFTPLFATVVPAGLGRHTGAAAAAVVTAQTLGTSFGTALVIGAGGLRWWAIVFLFLLLAGLVAGLMVTAEGGDGQASDAQ